MKVDLFDFDLPEGAIALRPAKPRDAARLLVVAAEGPLSHCHVRDLPGLLRPGDAIVVNVTRVIPARLRGVRLRAGREARIEILLHRRLSPERWLAFARPAKRMAKGEVVRFAGREPGVELLEAEIEDRGASGEISLRFRASGTALDEAVARLGEMPLPPYIASQRPADGADAADYQTVFARTPGAVAAPTAGLHVTEELLARLAEAGISRHEVTLHVGAGTFLPVKADDTNDHRMHSEWGEVDEATAAALNAVHDRGGRVVAIGTTSLRLLESATGEDGRIRPFSGETDIFITPGYRFRAVDLLLTNFHLPRSTLFMLVCAFAGLERMRAAYAEAIASGYRFYSYGDGSLLERNPAP